MVCIPNQKIEYRRMSLIVNGPKTEYEVLLKPIPHLVRSQNIQIRGWYKSKHESKRVLRNRPCYTEHMLTQPYGGTCHVNCAFCYINNGVRGYRSTGVAVVDVEYPAKVERDLQKLYVASCFYISSFTEPFQKLERYYGNVRLLSNVAIKAGLPILYCTRMIPPSWAIENLTKNPYSYVQWSISTSDNSDWRILSPGAPSLGALFAAIKRISERGIYTSLQINPIVLGVTSVDKLRILLVRAKNAGIKHVIFKFVEIVFSSIKSLLSKMERRFPKRYRAFEALFTQNIGGVRTIAQHVRIGVLKTLSAECERLGITMSLCYEYGLTSNGKLVNLARTFTTADQCHGRAIPIFYRNNLKDKFQALPGCTGACLYCVETGSKVCKNGTLLAAKALSYADYKKLKLDV